MYDQYKNELYEILLGDRQEQKFLDLVESLRSEGYSSMIIYDLFLEFHKEIQIDPRTKDNEELYDLLSDFMDTLLD